MPRTWSPGRAQGSPGEDNGAQEPVAISRGTCLPGPFSCLAGAARPEPAHATSHRVPAAPALPISCRPSSRCPQATQDIARGEGAEGGGVAIMNSPKPIWARFVQPSLHPVFPHPMHSSPSRHRNRHTLHPLEQAGRLVCTYPMPCSSTRDDAVADARAMRDAAASRDPFPWCDSSVPLLDSRACCSSGPGPGPGQSAQMVGLPSHDCHPCPRPSIPPTSHQKHRLWVSCGD